MLDFPEEQAHKVSTKGWVSCYAHFLLLKRDLLWVLKTVYTRAGGELTDPQEGCKLKDIKLKSSGEQPCLGVRP